MTKTTPLSTDEQAELEALQSKKGRKSEEDKERLAELRGRQAGVLEQKGETEPALPTPGRIVHLTLLAAGDREVIVPGIVVDVDPSPDPDAPEWARLPIVVKPLGGDWHNLSDTSRIAYYGQGRGQWTWPERA